MTVLVTTCLTLTARGTLDRGGSAKYRVLPSMIQLLGEYGERRIVLLGVALRGVALLGVELFGVALLDVELRGDSLMEEYGDCGMRSLLSAVGVRDDVVRVRLGRTKGVGGIRGAEVAEAVEAFFESQLQAE